MQSNNDGYFQSHYMPNTPADRAEMLEVLGLDSVTLSCLRISPRSTGTPP